MSDNDANDTISDTDIAYAMTVIDGNYVTEDRIASTYIDMVKELFTNPELETIKVDPDMVWSFYRDKVKCCDRFCAMYHPEDDPDAVKALVFGDVSENIEAIKKTISILINEVLKGDVTEFPELDLELPDEAYGYSYGNKAIEKIEQLYEE